MGKTTIHTERNKLARISYLAGIIAVVAFALSYLIAGLIEGSSSIPLLYIAFAYFFYFLYAFILIAPLTAITAGIVALAQIKKSREAGKGHAMAGIILGVIGLTPLLLLVSSWL